MEEFLLKLQESDFGVWVSSAPTLLAYPTILMLHTVGLALVVGPIAVLDLRLLGVGQRMPISALRNVFKIMWWGFALNAATGIALFISEADDKGEQVDFYVKLTLIALALVVAVPHESRMLFRPTPTMPSSTVSCPRRRRQSRPACGLAAAFGPARSRDRAV